MLKSISIIIIVMNMGLTYAADKDLIFYSSFDKSATPEIAIAPKVLTAKGLEFVPGKLGNAVYLSKGAMLRYDGKNMQMPKGTIAMWIKRDKKWNEKRNCSIFSTRSKYAWNNNSIYCYTTCWKEIGLRIFPYVKTNKGYYILSSSDIPYDANIWYHFVTTYTDGAIKIYINGKEISYKKRTKATEEMPMFEFKMLMIGSGLSPKTVLNGAIDELRIYKVVLSAKQIAELYQKENK